MALPVILGVLALGAGSTGIGTAASGIKDFWQAKKANKEIQKRYNEACDRHSKINDNTEAELAELGKLELEIMNSFNTFSTLIEKMQRRPKFSSYDKNDISISGVELKELKNVSQFAQALLGNLGGIGMGALSGLAASGAVTSIVTALGTAGTGTAISTLSGAAATNAVLATLGGGSLAAGGGGIALGSLILNSLTCGFGILVSGIVIKITSKKMQGKQKECEEKAGENIYNINKICEYLNEIAELSTRYRNALTTVKTVYDNHICKLSELIEQQGKTDWKNLSHSEKNDVRNTVLLVSLLYKMCKVQVTKQTEGEDGMQISEPNTQEINAMISQANIIVKEAAPKNTSFLHKFFHRRS